MQERWEPFKCNPSVLKGLTKIDQGLLVLWWAQVSLDWFISDPG